jgi:hypothetical protein
MNRIALATVALIATTGASLAGDATYHRKETIDAVQGAQIRKIEDARYSGELTRREYRQLLAEQARVQELERRALEDGRISRQEYNVIRGAQKSADSHIKSEAHDGQISFWRRWLYRTRG